MKYEIETNESGCTERLTLRDGRQYMKRHIRTDFGSRCLDDEFYEQMEQGGVTDERVLDIVCDVLDGSFQPLSIIQDAERMGEQIWRS